jgi:hypothetical protein
MAFIFGDSFDLYAAPADAIASYWDSGTVGFTLVAGRFAGSRAVQSFTVGAWLLKSSGSNDPVHHIVCAFQQTAALSGTTLGVYLSLGDGATAQSTIVFRSDGAILLTSGGPTGAALATYTGAVTAPSQWFAFEFEVVINNTTGSFAVRKNGNTVSDFTATSLNTRVSTNNYASRLTVGQQVNINQQLLDDLLWRSDPSVVPWVGDIRCYTRMPVSDASVQFAVSSSAFPQNPNPTNIATAMTALQARYVPFVAACNGTIGSATLSFGSASTGNFKAAIYTNNAGVPGTVLATAATVSAPPAGVSTFTFSSPPTVVAGITYWIGIVGDASGTVQINNVNSLPYSNSVVFATFPTSNPAITGTQPFGPSPYVNITYSGTENALYVGEPQEDGTVTYVYDSTTGQADLYNIAAIPTTPVSVVAVTTRGLAQKSDAGSRVGAVQVKSGGTTVASPSTALSTTWGWLWRTDTTDPATGAAWTPTGVNNAQIGPTVIS